MLMLALSVLKLLIKVGGPTLTEKASCTCISIRLVAVIVFLH